MKLRHRLTALGILLAMMLALAAPALAYDFPQPDWTALYNQRWQMVTDTEFGLYAQGPVSSAPYYGAKFEPKAGTYLGTTVDSADNLLPVGSVLTYIYGTSGQDDLYWPSNTMLHNGNMIAMVGWTIEDLNTIDYNYVDSMLKKLNDYGKPMLIRFANEMNISAIGNEPSQYVAAFRKAADLIHKYPNLGVVWSPNDLGGLDRPFELYYPGDSYVDWIGISCYMRKYFQGDPASDPKDSVYFMAGDYAWATNAVKPILDFMAQNHIQKPLMLSECGVETKNTTDGEKLEAWATPRFRNLLWYLVMKYPQIKMINLFNKDSTAWGERSGYEVNSYGYAVSIVNEAKNSGAYLTQYGQTPDFVFQPANQAGTLTAKNDVVKLYTLAYDPQLPVMSVQYALDGSWYHASSKAPYTCNLKVSALSDGAHTMEIYVEGTGHYQKYTLYKKGRCVRFGAEPDPAAVAAAEQAERGSTVAGFKDVFEKDYYAQAVKWTKENNITKGTEVDQFSPNDPVTRAQAVTFLWRAMGSLEPVSTESPFEDVKEPREYYYKAVLWAAEQGITTGEETDRFGVENSVTCAQMITFLSRAAGQDAYGGDWAEKAQTWARSHGLLDGIPKTFRGTEKCPRSDVVYYIWKYLN